MVKFVMRVAVGMCASDACAFNPLRADGAIPFAQNRLLIHLLLNILVSRMHFSRKTS
jgi:hypothetical protein